MFSILNEIKDDSPRSTLAVIASSIGSAASIYILVAITGYLTFGNRIAGNIVLMCKYNKTDTTAVLTLTLSIRPTVSCFHHRPRRHRCPCPLLDPPPSPPLSRLPRRRFTLASKQAI